jgi:dTDP-4-amino-4,6-dideoxygalactose transaminase
MQPTLPALEDVVSLYNDVYKSGLITNARLVSRLESAVAERLRVKHCIAVSSCTSGLALTLKAFGLQGEVVVPSFTFFASGEAILWNGLKPVFADCNRDSWNVDAEDVARCLTPSTTAIMAVHMYGNPAEINKLEVLAEDAGVKLIFDAAHAFGSSYCGLPIGGFGDAEVFSLSPTKLLVAGEGGLVTTNDATLANRLRAGRNYGDLGNYNPILCGLNARMSEFNAALALSGLRLVDEKIARHNEIAARYSSILSGIEGISFQNVLPMNGSTFKDFSLHIASDATGWYASGLCAALSELGVPTKRYFYPPLHQQDIFAPFHHCAERPLRMTELVSEGVVSLPIYASLSNEQVDAIGKTVRDLLLNPIK